MAELDIAAWKIRLSHEGVRLYEPERLALIAALEDREGLRVEVSCLATLIREDAGGFLETVDGHGYLTVESMPLVTEIFREERRRLEGHDG